MFIGGLIFGHYSPLGIGLGIIGGYYNNSYTEFILGNTVNQQTEKIETARFMIIPRLSLYDKIFFLDELSANIGFFEKLDTFRILSNLAFSAIQIGAAKLGVDIYYEQYKYNMLLEQRLFGAKFASKYLSFDIGYRQFLNTSDNPIVANYKDGIFGRIIAKIWFSSDAPILLSYGFEQTFEMHHFVGIGIQVGPNSFGMDSIIEMNPVSNDLRMGAVLPYIP